MVFLLKNNKKFVVFKGLKWCWRSWVPKQSWILVMFFTSLQFTTLLLGHPAYWNYVYAYNIIHAHMYRRSKIMTPINSTSYSREMKPVPINMGCCLLQFDALKFFLGAHSHGGGALPNCILFNVKTEIWQRNILLLYACTHANIT